MNEEKDNNSAIIRRSISPSNYSESVNRISRQDNDDEDHHSPQFFLAKGNEQFLHKRFISAIEAYSLGLKWFEKEEEDDGIYATRAESQPKNLMSNEGRELDMKKNANDFLSHDLLSNRALAYLSIGNYSAALEDTRKVLSVSPTHFKATLRQAKALSGLSQFQNAINLVEGLLTSKGKNCSRKKTGSSGGKFTKEEVKELQLYLEKLRWRKHQSETGDNYDVPLTMDRPFEPAPSDWVDHTGPVVVKNIPGKGRGIVATENIPASKLVFACRAFEIIFLDAKSKPGDGLSKESLEALISVGCGGYKIEKDVTLNLLARKVYDRLTKNPERRAEFYQLHAGNELGYLESSSESTDPPALDMARIYGICRTNTFANSGDSYPEVEKSVGIWLFPAFVNHQCVGGNCTWKIFGDFIFFRTYTPVKKGQELTVSYVSPAYSLLARTELLTTRLGFVCSCKLCELDRELSPSVHDDKAKLKQLALKQEVNFSQLDIPRDSEEYGKKVEASILLLEQIITKLEKMHPHHGQYNASLLDPLQKLGLKYFGIGEFQKTAKVMERACTLMKSCMLPHAIADASMWVIAAYLHMGNNKQAKKWGKVLKDNLVQAYGDVQVLRILGSWLLEPMTEWGFV